MSLVGTRPPTVDEYEQYELGHRKRLAMKPGLTGMWQVSGRSDITDFDEVVALDAKYIEQWDDFVISATFPHTNNQTHSIIKRKFAMLLTHEIMSGSIGEEPMMLCHIRDNKIQFFFYIW